jgi:hypothetical protein
MPDEPEMLPVKRRRAVARILAERIDDVLDVVLAIRVGGIAPVARLAEPRLRAVGSA